jgi:hypothetical protein
MVDVTNRVTPGSECNPTARAPRSERQRCGRARGPDDQCQRRGRGSGRRRRLARRLANRRRRRCQVSQQLSVFVLGFGVSSESFLSPFFVEGGSLVVRRVYFCFQPPKLQQKPFFLEDQQPFLLLFSFFSVRRLIARQTQTSQNPTHDDKAREPSRFIHFCNFITSNIIPKPPRTPSLL